MNIDFYCVTAPVLGFDQAPDVAAAKKKFIVILSKIIKFGLPTSWPGTG
jgi:hypothetical protein